MRAFHFETILDQSVKNYSNEFSAQINTISGVGLIIHDWSGATDNGWRIVHHTGVVNSIRYDNYEEESSKMLSFNCGYTFSQAFERLCSFIKDCIIQRGKLDPLLLIRKTKNGIDTYNRSNLPGGDPLYKLIKKAAGNYFNTSSLKNNTNIKFSEFWSIIYETRNAIVHAESIAKSERVKTSLYHDKLFHFLYPNHVDLNENVELFLTYKNLESLIGLLADFAFQIFKAFSIQEELEREYFIQKFK